MSKARLEFRVGVFVVIALSLLAVLMMQFSKGASLFRSKTMLTLNAPNVAGLKQGAEVLLAGVVVGSVRSIDLGPRGTNVIMRLEILSRYPIHSDARFAIEQSGFLGDQYVAVIPTKNEGPLLTDEAEVFCEAPFNLQEVARDAGGILQRIDKTAGDLNEALAEVRKSFLNEDTLADLAETAGNLREASSEAKATVQNVNQVIEINRQPISAAVTNLVLFSERLNVIAESANTLIDTNKPAINDAIQDIRESAESLKKLLKTAESGDNLAAALLADEELAIQVSQIVSNLSMTSSNLNERGLWGIMWKPKEPKPDKPQTYQQLRTPGDPFR